MIARSAQQLMGFAEMSTKVLSGFGPASPSVHPTPIAAVEMAQWKVQSFATVSYTHLTLPTLLHV